MKRPNILSSTHPAVGIAVGAVTGTALLVGGIFVSNYVADQNSNSSTERTSSQQSVSTDATSSSSAVQETSPSTQPTGTEGASTSTGDDKASTATATKTVTASKTATTTQTATATKARSVLRADVSKRNLSVFTTPDGLHCGLYGGEEGTSAFCRMEDRSVYSIPHDESSVCALGDNPGELYVVTVDQKSGWGCTTEPDPEPVLSQSATNGVFYKGAIAWYKSSPFPAAVKGTKAASGKAYVPVGGVLKSGNVECEVQKGAVQCVNTSTKAGFVFTNKSVKFAKERTYAGEKG